jgi:hypothetical protein
MMSITTILTGLGKLHFIRQRRGNVHSLPPLDLDLDDPAPVAPFDGRGLERGC